MFPGEPDIDPRWVEQADFCTPHVAGNTHEAKWLATEMLLRQALEAQGQGLPDPRKPPRRKEGEGGSSETGALERLNEKTGLVSLSREFQTAIGKAGMQDIGACFRGIRKTSRRWLLPNQTPLAAPTEFFGGSGIRSKLDL